MGLKETGGGGMSKTQHGGIDHTPIAGINVDNIDKGLLADRPTADGSQGLYIATDDQTWYLDDGGTWKALKVLSVPLNGVDLPTPASSGYATPSAVSVSSEGYILLDNCEAGWTYAETDTNAVISGTQPATDQYVEGAGSLKISDGDLDTANNDYGAFSKDIDLTDVNTLRIWVKGNTGGYRTKHEVNIGGTEEWSILIGDGESSFSYEQTITIDVSGYTGLTTVEMRATAIGGNPNRVGTFWMDFVRQFFAKSHLIDEDTATYWTPASGDTTLYAQLDIGSLKIVGAVRFYCGASGVPGSVDVKVSENGTDWETVESGFSPTSNSWNEVIFPARYVRYIRIVVSSTGDEIYEVDYWSRLIDRVASEHGHSI